MSVTGKLYAISDNPHIRTGLALAGISGQDAHTPEEVSRALEGLAQDIGIVIVTSGLAAKSADILEKYREEKTLPLITIIPEPVA